MNRLASSSRRLGRPRPAAQPSRQSRPIRWRQLRCRGLAILLSLSFGLPSIGVADVAAPPANPTVASQPAPTLTATLSQSKYALGSDCEVTLQVAVTTPIVESAQTARQPVDMVVVLDRSGSMAAEKRIAFAKSAILDLMNRLTASDRFALITFDTTAETVTPLTAMTDTFKSREQRVVQRLEPRGSTNMSGGLELARALLGDQRPGRVRKVLLLSDGEANLGVVDSTGLGNIARTLTAHDTILSTIGMGLGFNEALMASLADYGMGHYSYLEQLASLGTILNKDLEDTRSVFAASSQLELSLPTGVQLVDAGGLPLEPLPGKGNTYQVLTGQLLSGSTQNIYVTLKAPTSTLGRYNFGSLILSYSRNGIQQTALLDGSALALEIIPAERREEAVASINRDVYRQAWATNKVGIAQKKMSASLRKGDIRAAEQQLQDIQDMAHQAESDSGVAVADLVAPQVSSMNRGIAELKSAAPAAQEDKRNRLAKELLSQGRTNQLKDK